MNTVNTYYLTIITDEKTIINIYISFESIEKVYPPDVGVVADAKEALRLFTTFTPNVTWTQWTNERNLTYKKVTHLDVTHTDDLNKQIISHIQEKLPDDALLITDAGNFAVWLHTFYPFTKKHTYI